MIPGTIRETFIGDLAAIVNIDNVEFTNVDFIDFTYVNRLNEAPFGQIRVSDIESNFMRTSSGSYGRMVFTNTTDNASTKFSLLDFYVENMVNEAVEGSNSKHNIIWRAGVTNHNKKITNAYTGNSTKVMEEIFQKANVDNGIKFPTSGIEPPNDTMTWVIPQSNMWEQLDAVVSKSYRKNDYMFWAWDDVNNTFKISSFEAEKKLNDRYVLLESENAARSTKEAKLVKTDGSSVAWLFSNVKKMNRLGVDYDKIFPNVAFSGMVDGDLASTGFRQKSFKEMLQEQGDSKIDELVTFEGSDEVTYGDLVIKRHWPNNVHKMYSFADIYRDYKLATHAKRVVVQIFNNIGPPLGSKVSFIKTGDSFKSGKIAYDYTFTDKYILYEKVVTYNVKSSNPADGNETMSSSNFITTLTLISDNFTPDRTASEEIADDIASNKLI